MSNDIIAQPVMTLNEYQKLTARTAVYPGQGSFLSLMYVVGKLNGEAGEVAELVFKALRDDELAEKVDILETNLRFPMDAVVVRLGYISEERRKKLIKEYGDILWYVARGLAEIGCTLGEAAYDNIVKLSDRKERGVLSGSGDDR